jgi:hypothetical protein
MLVQGAQGVNKFLCISGLVSLAKARIRRAYVKLPQRLEAARICTVSLVKTVHPMAARDISKCFAKRCPKASVIQCLRNLYGQQLYIQVALQ